MSKIDDGGPAFPVVEVHPVHGSRVDMGMTLRDWFAGQALAGLTSSDVLFDIDQSGIAHDCYQYADAMLKARKQ